MVRYLIYTQLNVSVLFGTQRHERQTRCAIQWVNRPVEMAGSNHPQTRASSAANIFIGISNNTMYVSGLFIFSFHDGLMSSSAAPIYLSVILYSFLRFLDSASAANRDILASQRYEAAPVT